MSAAACLSKTYVKFRYIAPDPMDTPMNCRAVVITKFPKIRIFTGQISKLEGARSDEIIGVTLHCAVPTTEGAGGIILLLQVSTYLEWEVGFMNQRGRYVNETHRVFLSLPVMHKLQGPMIALMALTPWKLKIPTYIARIAAAFHKISEVEGLIGKVAMLYNGHCPDDLKRFIESLRVYEIELNNMLQRAAHSTSEGDIAKRMERAPVDSGRFAATRLA